MKSIAALLCALLVVVAACGSPVPMPSPTSRPSVLTGVHPTPPALPSSRPTPPPPSPSPIASSPSATVFLDAGGSPTYSGEPVSLRIDAYTSASPPVTVPVNASVDFGDGSVGSTGAACTAPATLEHVYQRGGDYHPRVIVVTTCGQSVTADLSAAATTVLVLPSASAASASWPTCTTFQLRLSGFGLGAAMGNIADLIVLQNRSTTSCTLAGYPGLQLVASDGRVLPTTVAPPSAGAYSFPLLLPHRVALPPGAYASFELGWEDNPSGAGNNEPYAVACPSSAWVRVILPGTDQYGTAALPMGACGGHVEVSPLVPGSTGFSFGG
jgi:hypothetical protein